MSVRKRRTLTLKPSRYQPSGAGFALAKYIRPCPKDAAIWWILSPGFCDGQCNSE